LTRGVHSLKMGFAFERVQLNAFDPAPAGEIAFGTLADSTNNGFLTNNPIVLFAPLPSAPFIHFNFRSSIFGGYIQDDVRLRPTLTLNLGLRYEMSTVPSEAHGHLSALHSPINQTFQDTIVGSTVFKNPTYHNFEPRIGFAWDPFGNGKSSVRGGFAIFDVLPLPYLLGQFATNTAPFTENGTASNLPAGSFPTGAFDILATNAANNLGLRIPYIQPNPKRNYIMQWNLNIQRELAPNLTASVAYVGSRGVHMIFRADDINTVQPINGSTPPYLWPAPPAGGQPNPTISPAIGRMDTLQWNNDSYFHGLEVQIEKRMSHGFQVQGSYTWSRAIDGGDGSIASDSFVNSIPSLFYFLPKYRRAASDFNITHNLTMNYLWNIPTSNSLHGPIAWAAKGWQLGGIMQLKTGLPFTPLIGGDPLGLNNSSPFAYPDRLTGGSCSAPVNPQNSGNYLKLSCFALPVATPAIAANCVPFSENGVTLTGTCANLLGNSGRNSVYGPGFVNFDFSVVKDTHIGERLDVQFRGEIFNLFNRPNFNPPLVNNVLFDQGGVPNSAAGTLDSTANSSRQVQFALKLIF
ncbi:MAG: TonB-dependent receptor plug, partial [Candidatus Sulfotelmatobacter sp.]|nr:TonB-dependent receptor plug [Candidatus Sulfotelmatobacter sp.]